jgi:DNA-binding NarL/FixJ family response regulator
MPVAVIVYDDNENLRESLGNLITFSSNLVLLGSFPVANEVAAQIAELQPDVVIMDIDMPGMNGVDAVKTIRGFDQKVQIIMLTVFDDNQHVLDAIIAGANGYLLKKNISGHLLEAITQVMEGGVPMSPGIARMVINSMQKTSLPDANLYNLTTREKEILSSLSRGNSYKMIASELKISIDTVRSHIKNIYEKLKVHTQTEAVSKAVTERLV